MEHSALFSLDYSFPLNLYVFILICQSYVLLLERTNKDIIYNVFNIQQYNTDIKYILTYIRIKSFP